MKTRWLRLALLLQDDPVEAAVRVLGLARAQLLFRGCELGEGVGAGGYVRAVPRGRLRIDRGASFVGGMIPTELVCHEGATLAIGADSVLNYGASLEAHESVTLGRRCMVASMVRVADRAQGRRGPVVIGDDCWLAHGAIVEPGVTIGAGSVVSAGSVVTADVPPGCLAAGNPARSLSLSLVANTPSRGVGR